MQAEQAFPYWCLGWKEEHRGTRAPKNKPEDQGKGRAKRRAAYRDDGGAELEAADIERVAEE